MDTNLIHKEKARWRIWGECVFSVSSPSSQIRYIKYIKICVHKVMLKGSPWSTYLPIKKGKSDCYYKKIGNWQSGISIITLAMKLLQWSLPGNGNYNLQRTQLERNILSMVIGDQFKIYTWKYSAMWTPIPLFYVLFTAALQPFYIPEDFMMRSLRCYCAVQVHVKFKPRPWKLYHAHMTSKHRHITSM